MICCACSDCTRTQTCLNAKHASACCLNNVRGGHPTIGRTDSMSSHANEPHCRKLFGVTSEHFFLYENSVANCIQARSHLKNSHTNRAPTQFVRSHSHTQQTRGFQLAESFATMQNWPENIDALTFEFSSSNSNTYPVWRVF